MAGSPPKTARRRGPRGPRSDFDDDRGIEDSVVKLYRCATVVKGGRRFSFGALVVVGDRRGQVGFGYGKANEVPPAVEKGVKQARRAMFRVPLRGTTIPHRVIGRFGASRVALVPAAEGTGVIAGSAVRKVLELAGVKDVLTKSYGSTSPKNLVKATIDGLQQLCPRARIEELRGVKLDLPPEPRPHYEVEAEREAARRQEEQQREPRGRAERGRGAEKSAEPTPAQPPPTAPAVEPEMSSPGPEGSPPSAEAPAAPPATETPTPETPEGETRNDAQ